MVLIIFPVQFILPKSRLYIQHLFYLFLQLSSGHSKYNTSKGELTFILLPKPALPEPCTSQLLAVRYLQLNQSKPCIILDCFLFFSLSSPHNYSIRKSYWVCLQNKSRTCLEFYHFLLSP